MFDFHAYYDLLEIGIRVIRSKMFLSSKWYKIFGKLLQIRIFRFVRGRLIFRPLYSILNRFLRNTKMKKVSILFLCQLMYPFFKEPFFKQANRFSFTFIVWSKTIYLLFALALILSSPGKKKSTVHCTIVAYIIEKKN